MQISHSLSLPRFPKPALLAAAVVCAGLLAVPVRADGPTITIQADKAVGEVSPRLYGLMTEEINHSYDGGLYAELVQNRAFLDDPNTPVHWSAVPDSSAAAITLDAKQPLNTALPVSLRLNAATASASAPAGIANEGYWGIPVQPDTRYRASFFARAAPGFSGRVTVALQSDDGRTVYARAVSPALTPDWRPYNVTLRTGKVPPTTKARYVLTVQRPGTVWFSLVSLFPPTWNNRPNGLRKDLMQMLVDMKPRFLRFPGGNYLEGSTVATRFDWKKTIGPLEDRPGHPGPWGYRSTDGMGLLEFLEWCEDLHMEPVLAVYAGYSLRGEHVNPGTDLQPYVQDALDEIEYVTGSASTKWGAQRVRDGHPKPFPLHYVEIGNEDWFDRSGSYDARFASFFDAIKRRYPQIKCISTVGNEQPESRRVTSRRPDVLDEHYYRNYARFLQDAPTRFEGYDRKGPEIFVGEWAAYETDAPPWDRRTRAMALPVTPSFKAALGDAAWMAAMERSADIVTMQCYAPLLVNANPGAYQWRPNLIGYDALHSYGSPSYYAIQMFSRNLGDEILKVTPVGTPVQAAATRDSRTGEIVLKFVNAEAAPQPVTIALRGLSVLKPTATAITLTAEPDAANTLDAPRNVAPVTTEVRGIPHPTFAYTLPAHSIVVLKLRTR